MILELPAAPELERKISDLSSEANAIAINDQASLDRAGEILLTIKATRAEIDATFDPIISRAYAAHREACSQKKRVEQPFVAAEQILKTGISRYVTEQERLRKEQERALQAEAERQRLEQEAEARRLQEESDRRHAEEIEAQIEQAESRGAEPEFIAELANTPAPVVHAPEPVFMPTPVVASTVTKPAGVSMRDNWSAEVHSIRQLAAEVGAGRQPEELLIGLDRNKETQRISSPALNKMATALKSALRIPGVRPLNVPAVSARSR